MELPPTYEKMGVSFSFSQTFPERVPEVGLAFWVVGFFFFPFSTDSFGLILAVNFEPQVENVQSQTIQLVFHFLCVALTRA